MFEGWESIVAALPSGDEVAAGVSGSAHFVGSNAYGWWIAFWDHPLGKAALLLGGVFLIVWLIALIYSGEVQRSLSGPN
ncbi:MAG: hypothetical protein DCF16_16605 [Alphaproteobacteria bacterium]|nr:MAG: hypothetical protein DCF16_16605 [Alphaproteobacteria bacterium]